MSEKRYIGAAKLVENLEAEILTLRERVAELERSNQLLVSNMNSKPCAMESVSQTMAKAQPPKESNDD